ncbi:MAG: DUF4332 domain-containing protein [Cyanobacteriota bacterium]|nr:DUF4332 domain-containing protein [Cyanobacteriota bacterium]
MTEYALDDIESVRPDHAQRLALVGITTVSHLLEKGVSDIDRAELSRITGIDRETIVQCIEMGELLQINGIGTGYIKLLEAAGVDSVEKLKQYFPKDLHIYLVEINQQQQLVKVLPTLTAVESWVSQAKASQTLALAPEPEFISTQNYSEWSIEWAD